MAAAGTQIQSITKSGGDDGLSAAAAPKLRVGVIVAGQSLQAWQADALKALIDSSDAGVEFVVLVEPDRATADTGAEAPWLWRQCLRRIAKRSPDFALAPRALASVFDAGLPVVAATGGDNTRQHLPDAAVDAIRTHEPDFIVSFADAPFGTEMAALAKHGVWRYRLGTRDDGVADPPGFWEIYHGDVTVGLTLERVVADQPGVRVLRRGAVKTARYSYAKTLNRLGDVAGHWLWQCAREIRLNGGLPCGEIAATRAYRRPSTVQVCVLGVRVLSGLIGALLDKAFYIDQWSIGVARAPVESFIADPQKIRFDWIRAKRRVEFVADPFVCEDDGLNIYCEYLDHWVGVGEIAVLQERDGFAVDARKTVISDGSHFSYPYVIRQDDGVLVVPENHAKSRVIAYRFGAAGDDRPSATHDLLDGGDYVDATFMFHGGRYWCFVSRVDRGGEQNLYLYYADELLGRYQPHPLNPVKSDVRSSRPAGRIIRLADRILRPAQNCAATYGGSLAINEVLELTPERYREREVMEVTPDILGGLPDGCHHLEHAGDHVVVDSKRIVFHPMAWWFVLRDKLRARATALLVVYGSAASVAAQMIEPPV